MWKMNAEKDQSLELPEVSDHQAQSREPRVITRILCWTFFYAEMLLVCAWSMVRWRRRTRSLRPLTCWCREFSPSGLISSLLLALQTYSLLVVALLNTFIQSIFGGGVLSHSNYSSCWSVLTIFTLPFTPLKEESLNRRTRNGETKLGKTLLLFY